VMFIVAGAQIFSFALVQSGLERNLTDAIVGTAVTPGLFLAAIVVVYLVLGCFFDPLSTLLLTMPVLYPAVQRLGIDPIWFGIFLVVLIETGLITPPVGINLFVIKGIAGGATLAEVSRGALPYVLLLLVGLGLLVAFPGIALWLAR
jgi:C4-dicarboxylate transporter DctM subunit